MAVTGIIKNLAPVSLLAALLYAPPGLVERFLKSDSSRTTFQKLVRPILKILIGLGIAKTFNSALNSLATNHWRISSSPPTKPWDWPNEIAVVTGGCGGIGVALVRGLTAKGVKVAVLDVIDPPPELESNPNAVYFKCDITSSEAIAETADAIRRTLGGNPSILVNNAGIARINPLLEITETSLRQVIGVNLMALWFTTKQFLPAMIEADKGHIITVASLASFLPLTTSIDYSATKSGALAFHEGLTAEIKHVYKARGVKTSIVHPDFVQTAMTQPFAGQIEKSQKMLTVEDISRPVLAQIFSGRGGQLILPKYKSFASAVRGWPNWMQEIMRDTLVKGFL
ncbi:Short-chain dehydrogenase/reductase family 16C member 6 [Cytospora mali]|uniref:Short-chain dehydrogenase/reductase 3 n=1 Tax=Cytospora mali TaxID=578113 RepID=A0A194VCF1_CYTMA|nr:Short-chain dehydrogenase/reductase family 16C member 6 [Valsa mali var. pyri (nom. inval.)]